MENSDIELNSKLTNIQKVLNINKLLSRNVTTSEVSKYYKLNRLAYRIFHSKDGFVHMGISEGPQYKEEDTLVQPNLVASYIEKNRMEKVLELAAGKGSNIIYLAKKYPHCTFFGLDLPNGQLNLGNKAFNALNNLKLSLGDFHTLNNYDSETFDMVYVIEALCHSDKKEQVVGEVYRVLKSGGLFIVIDGFLNKPADGLNREELLAKLLTEKGMMVGCFEYVEDFKNKIIASGFNLQNEKDYSDNILPNLRRFERLAGKVYRHKTMGKMISKLLPEEIIFNSVSGYLLPYLVQHRIACYKLLVFQKQTAENYTNWNVTP